MPALPPPFRSSFINVPGWIFICLAGFGTPIGLLQNLTLQLAFLPTMQQQMAAQPLPSNMPAPMGRMLAHMIWVFRAFLWLSVATVITAVGLLLRRNWGRLLFRWVSPSSINCSAWPSSGGSWVRCSR